MSGRPSKLTPDTQRRIFEALSVGATYQLACQYAGIHYDTFRNWMKRGETAKSGQYFEFFEAVKEAEGRAVVGWLAKIEQAASAGNWQAAAWKLERRYPADYGRKDRIDITHSIQEEARRIVEANPDLDYDEVLAEAQAILAVKK